MEIKLGEPIKANIAKIVLELTTEKQRIDMAKKWGFHFNTLKNKLRDEDKVPIQSDKQIKMFNELFWEASKNLEDKIYNYKTYKAELEKVVN